MTPMQQAYLDKLRANADANLEFFKENLPALHEQMVGETPTTTVDISEQGDLTIRFADGTALDMTGHILKLEANLREFADPAVRPQLLAFHALRAVQEGEAGHGDMQRYHYSNLDAEFPNRMKRHFVEHYPNDDDLFAYPDFGADHIPLLVVLGSGYGWHLQRLVADYRIRRLVIVDLDPEAFRISTFFIDYVQLSRVAMEKGTSISFVIDRDMERLSRTFMTVLKRNYPPYFIHGASLFYAAPHNKELREVRNGLLKVLWQLFFGLGYFDDELLSIRHGFANLRNRVPVYTRSGKVADDAVAFIIGSGPSLDALLPLLQGCRDRAVLFSCGTALGPLSHAGVQPDFHVEKERPYIVYEVLTKTVGEEFLKGSHFIGINVIHPDVFPLFGSCAMALKSTDTVTNLLCEKGPEIQLNTQPTVTNTALAIALSLGFRQVYLVGVDLGFKDKTKHHSAHTAYLGKMPDTAHLQKLLSKPQASDDCVPGNFGGEVHTLPILTMSRIFMEHEIAAHPAAGVFNLNDGVAIKGATPLRQEDFVCSADPARKQETIARILDSFEVRQYDLEALGHGLLARIDAFVAEVGNILSTPQANKDDVLEKLIALYRHISAIPNSSPINILFSGSIMHLATHAYQFLSIIREEGEAAAKAEFDLALLLEHLQQARAAVAQTLAEG